MNRCKTLCAATLLLFGCNYNESKQLAENGTLTQKIISADQITFKIIQEKIINEACLKCHSASGGNKGGINLETFAAVEKLTHEIRKEVAGGTMPPNAKLSESQIKLLTDWIDAGAFEHGKISGEIPTPAPVPKPTPTPAPTPNPTPAPAPAPPKLNFESVFNLVIKTNCLKCHSAAAGNKGDVNLETFENVFLNRNTINDVVSSGEMPTKRGTPLTLEQKTMILAWIQKGSPK